MEKKRHFSMIRDFHVADFFTLANAFCGMGAVFAAMTSIAQQREPLLLVACAFIPAALVFDFLDGRIARSRQEHSPLGRELDSLSDVISFGVAPACIAFASGMNHLLDAIILCYFVGCGVSRLARYNITADSLATESGKVKYFEGTPIPTSILLVGILAYAATASRTGAHLYWGEWSLGPLVLHPLAVLFAISGSLMISKTLHIPKI